MLGEIAIVLLLLLLNGFFAMAELAIVSARRAVLKQWVDERRKGARLALQLAEDPNSFLSIVQVGITLNGVLAGAFSGATLAARFGEHLKTFPIFAEYGDSIALAVTVVGITYLSLVIGELVPKRIGIAYAEPIALKVAGFMRFLAKVTLPIVWLLNGSTVLLLRLMGLNKAKSTAVTEDEVKVMISEGTETGVFEQAEKEMLEGVMRLSDRSVRSIMTPRIDLVWLNIADAGDHHTAVIQASGYSRFPVAAGDLEKVLGVVHAKDMLNSIFAGQQIDLASIMRPPLVVPDTTQVLRLLDQFKQSGQHIAIVIDEYGSVEGLVSITDILEAITGVMPDPQQDDDLYKPVQRDDGSWLLDGMTPIDEVESLLGFKNMQGDGDFHTLAGFMIEKLGRIPSASDHFTWNDARFEVMDMDGRRVDKVMVVPAHAAEDSVPNQG